MTQTSEGPSPLKQAYAEAMQELHYYKALVGSFMTGEVQAGANDLSGVIMAQWGRKRLNEALKQAALLRGNI
jgi:hypothetical protein